MAHLGIQGHVVLLPSDYIHAGVSLTASTLIDIDNVCDSQDAITLHQLSSLTADMLSFNVVHGNTFKNEREDPTFFTSSFPTLFPYGTGKHLDNRRLLANRELSLQEWTELMILNASR